MLRRVVHREPVTGIETTVERAKGVPERQPLAVLVAVSKFCEANDIPRVTFWRWQKRSWVKTIRIAGRLYMTREEMDRFMARAQSGEFSSATTTHEKQGTENKTAAEAIGPR